MSRQPSVTYKPKDTYYRDGKEKGMFIQTYALVKKQMKRFLEDSYDNEVDVVRERRGEWGEWFERWSIIDGKPKIIKQTWL